MHEKLAPNLIKLWALMLLGPLGVFAGVFAFPTRVLTEPTTWFMMLQWLLVSLLLASGILGPLRSRGSGKKALIVSLVCSFLWFLSGLAIVLAGVT
jgi:hypothetical protein